MWPGGGGGSVGSNCGRRRDNGGGSRWRQTEWGGNGDIERVMQSVIKRGGNAGREVAIMVVQRERRRCNNQPAQERCSMRRETVA
jgi:hypothetical protein